MTTREVHRIPFDESLSFTTLTSRVLSLERVVDPLYAALLDKLADSDRRGAAYSTLRILDTALFE